MKIGVITYYKVMNFGATLQAASTYCYLKNHGHEPVFINYISKEGQIAIDNGKNDPQWKAQLNFVNGIIKEQTQVCESAEDVMRAIKLNNIEALIIGSDALLQHHPFISRMRKGRRKPFYVIRVSSDRMFPNLFWGCGLNENIPTALMSVSSQNSAYQKFWPWTKFQMRIVLSRMRYISVRDNWTQSMVKYLTQKIVPITPDPVFAFNQNVAQFIPSKEEIRGKFNLPEKYVLFSLFTQVLSVEQIRELKRLFNSEGVSFCVLPMPTGAKYDFDADIDIKFPLSPIEWYALIKYSCGYIGSNMHPIVVSLHNAVPCYSIDNWGRETFSGKKINDGSSKILHIMKSFDIESNHSMINDSQCDVTPQTIFNRIKDFDSSPIKRIAEKKYQEYMDMMDNIIQALKNKDRYESNLL